MHHFPKNKPSQLDDDRVGARNDLYAFNNGENWEGIDAAKKRAGEKIKTPEQVVEDILSRLHVRLEVANGRREHIDRKTGEQVRVDPKRTNNIIRQASQALKRVLDKEKRGRFQNEILHMRSSFKTAK